MEYENLIQQILIKQRKEREKLDYDWLSSVLYGGYIKGQSCIQLFKLCHLRLPPLLTKHNAVIISMYIVIPLIDLC